MTKEPHEPDWKFLNDFKNNQLRLRPGFRRSYNEIKLPLRNNWTDKTVQTTLAIAAWCYEQGYPFMTEVPCLGGSRRADVVIPELTEAQCIEIYDTETISSINDKKEEYEKKGYTFLAVPAKPAEAIKQLEQKRNL